MRLGTSVDASELVPGWADVLVAVSVFGALTGLDKTPRCWKTGPKSFFSCGELIAWRLRTRVVLC